MDGPGGVGVKGGGVLKTKFHVNIVLLYIPRLLEIISSKIITIR